MLPIMCYVTMLTQSVFGHNLDQVETTNPKGLVMVQRRRNTRGFADPLRPCGPSLRPPQGPDVRLSKMSTLRRGDAAARAVIGPLSKA